MHILITGPTGFIGGHLRRALRGRGHALVLASRSAPAQLDAQERWLPLDFSALPATSSLASKLEGIDVAVNAVGIFRETAGQTFDALHASGPIAFFEACIAAGVRRIVQVSALGADAEAASRFHLSKRAADEALLATGIEAAVVQPSLVFGRDGASSRLFMMAATLPVLLLPAGGCQRVQPIHIDDLTEALVALCERPIARTGRVALVGAEALSIGDYLRTLRRSLGVDATASISVPAFAAAAAARLVDAIAPRPFALDAWAMLQRGNEGRVDATRALLDRSPRPPAGFVAPNEAAGLRMRAQLAWLLPVLRVSIAAVWIVTGIVSFGVYPAADSFALLERAGVPAALRPLALYGAAALDLGLGVASLLLRRRRWLWLAQIALILGYTAIITVRLPEFWLHPYGPVLKNLPMLAALWLLLELERREEPRP
jgi:uncharacterized protein YbjT (DUF2867 family)